MTLCEVKTHENILIVTLPQLIDHVAAATVERELKACVTMKPQSVLCNMAGTTYVSSSGLRVFLTIAKMAKVSRVHFGLFSITPFVNHVFDLSGFMPLFAIYPDEGTAMNAAAAWSAASTQ